VELPRSAAKRQEFKGALIRDLALKMGVDPSRILITALETAEEEIMEAPEGASMPNEVGNCRYCVTQSMPACAHT
jgi:hypothetical protein